MNATRLDAQGVTVPVAELVEVEPLAEAVGVAVAFGAGLRVGAVAPGTVAGAGA